MLFTREDNFASLSGRVMFSYYVNVHKIYSNNEIPVESTAWKLAPNTVITFMKTKLAYKLFQSSKIKHVRFRIIYSYYKKVH